MPSAVTTGRAAPLRGSNATCPSVSAAATAAAVRAALASPGSKTRPSFDRPGPPRSRSRITVPGMYARSITIISSSKRFSPIRMPMPACSRMPSHSRNGRSRVQIKNGKAISSPQVNHTPNATIV